MNWTPCAAVGFFCCALASNAPAGVEAPVRVMRGPGTEDCPDAQELARRVEAIRGSPAPPTNRGYRVSFTRAGLRFSAVIRPSSGRGARYLHATGQTCAALAKATAVTLALLLDSHPARESDAESKAASPARPPTVTAGPRADVRAPSDSEETPRDVTAAVGGAAIFGVLRPVAPALIGEAGLRVLRLRTSLGVLWLPSLDSELGPGTVSTSVLSGTVRGCFVPWLSETLELSTCSGAFVGVVSAEGAGYTDNDRSREPWLAVPIEVSLMHVVRPVAWEIGAGALIALRRYELAVDGVGVGYRSLPVGVMLSLRGHWLRSW